MTVKSENTKKIIGGFSGLTGNGKLKCHQCKKPLSPLPGQSYLILRKQSKNGQNITLHYYLCKDCLKQKIIPHCDEKDCKCHTCQDPDERLKHIHYDYNRGGECSCTKCGIVYEEGLLGNGTTGENKSLIRPHEPKDYDPLTQHLANNRYVDWFNQTKYDLVITCKKKYEHILSAQYPHAILVFIH